MLVYILAGAAAGLGYFFVLSRFTARVTGGGFTWRTALFGFLQFLIPLAVLLITAFANKDALLWVASAMAASLVIGAVIRFVLFGRKKGRDRKDD